MARIVGSKSSCGSVGCGRMAWGVIAMLCGLNVWSGLAVVAASPDQPGAKPLLAAVLVPASGAKDVCPDTPLRITFADVPIIGTGKIQVVDASNDAVVETVDVAVSKSTKVIGGLPNFSYYPVILAGKSAAIYLPDHALNYDRTYYVKIEPGAFKDGNGNINPGFADAAGWRFSTKAAPPAHGAKITVAQDGSGDFATVQGAIDFIPEGNATPVTVFIRNGTYNEIVFFTNKNNVTVLGEDRKKTIIAYPNNANFNNSSAGNPFAPGANPSTMPARTGSVYRRGMFLAHRVTDFSMANLTLHNTTPVGGSQAEAIILNGGPKAHAILTNLDLYSYQDTLQINGQAYISNCHIEGDVDFMWGTGPCFFENVEAKSLRSNAYYTQIRNTAANHGYVFKNCTFDGGPNVTGNFLSRIDPGRFPASEVVLIDCVMTNAVGPIAWKLDNAKESATVHYWEYNSHTPDGQPVDMSKRFVNAKQLKLPEDKETIANYSDAKWVLGGEWDPMTAPVLASQTKR